jgi:hypothetical protein
MLMSTKNNALALNAEASAALTAPGESAQSALDVLNGLRAGIPVFPFQVTPGERSRVNGLKTIPPEFMEQSSTAMKTELVLARGGIDPDQLRDFVRYGTAYGPVADVAEMLARELRESVDSAMAKAGSEALMTYSVAGRLAARRETAWLRPLVDMMRRTLGRSGKPRKGAETPAETPATAPASDALDKAA